MATLNIPNFFTSLERKLDKDTRKHLRNVYGSMAMAILSATAGAYVHLYTGLLSGGLLSSLASFGLIIALVSTPHNLANLNTRIGYLLGLAFSSGLTLGPLLEVALIINPSTIVTALICTSIIFVCFTLSTIFSDQKQWLYMGALLSSTLSILFYMSLLNLLLGSRLIFQTNLYIGLFVMCGFIIYDTSLIIEKVKRGDTDFIYHAMLLFVDFVSVFKNILVLLMQKEENQRRRRK